MHILATILAYVGAISLLLGYLGILFCGFTDSIGRGFRNLLLPFFGFGDAMRRFPKIIWLWGGGIAALITASLIHGAFP